MCKTAMENGYKGWRHDTRVNRGPRTFGNDLPLFKHHRDDKVQVNFRLMQQRSHGKMNPNKSNNWQADTSNCHSGK